MDRFWLPIGLIILLAVPGHGEEAASAARLQAFLGAHCVRCHGPGKQEGDFRADALAWPISETEQAELWQHVLDRLGAGEMPPAKEPRPPAKDLADFLELASTELRRASQQLSGGSNEVVLRRLNRIEYANTLRDLLGVEESLHTMLPEDPLSNGFDKVGSALTLSAEQIEAYLAAGHAALRSVIASAPQAPQAVKQRFNYHENKNASFLAYLQVLALDDKLVLRSTVNTYTQVRGFRAPVAANYRFRVAASTHQSTKPLQLVVHAGAVVGRNDVAWRIGFAEFSSDEPVVAEFQTRLRPGDSFYPRAFRLPHRPSREELTADYQGPGLALHWVEVEGPLYETWPVRGHRVLFGDLPIEETSAPAPASQRGRKSFAVVSRDPPADAERLLRAFLPRAFRRPISQDDLRPFRELALAEMNQHGASFQEAMLTAYQAVLCSPEFLFLRERSKELNDHELASRLSYFLWSSMPDEELLSLADEGKLRDPAVRRQQVERMLDSPKSREFTRNFCGQWLDLRKIDCTTPDRQLYPEFDEQLQEAMLKETELFFEEVLRNDLSLLNFVDSDWTILNRRLAEHYGLPEVEGLELRKVSLPPESPRGGLLTQASVLKVTANGTVTSPVLRGTWLLERILGQPPAPPPPNVPALEPDTRGAVTIREQYAAHRQVQACAACHAKIDPHGFALENFDPIGGWRDAYRSLGKGAAVDRTVDGVRVNYRQGPPVAAADVLPDQRRFDDIKQYKRLLLDQRDQIARSLCEKLLIYALGRGLALNDRPVVDRIVQRLQAENYGFRTLIHEIVASEPFVTK